jgi:hypothetical protein
MYVRVLLLLVLTVGGCSVSGMIPDWLSDDVAGPEPINYRFIVANGLGGIMGGKDAESRFLEISSPRRADMTKGATWMVCVKVLSYPSQSTRAYYAVFIQRDKIVESRTSLAIDLCESQSFTPFDWKSDVDKPIIR